MELFCIGLNHETAPVSVRERLALSGEPLEKALKWLRQGAQPTETVANLLSKAGIGAEAS